MKIKIGSNNGKWFIMLFLHFGLCLVLLVIRQFRRREWILIRPNSNRTGASFCIHIDKLLRFHNWQPWDLPDIDLRLRLIFRTALSRFSACSLVSLLLTGLLGKIVRGLSYLVSVEEVFNKLLARLLVLRYFGLFHVYLNSTVTWGIRNFYLEVDIAPLYFLVLVKHRVFEGKCGWRVSELIQTSFLIWVVGKLERAVQICVLLENEVWEPLLSTSPLLFFIWVIAWLV